VSRTIGAVAPTCLFTAAKRLGDGRSEVLKSFDPTAEERLFIPRLRGGLNASKKNAPAFDTGGICGTWITLRPMKRAQELLRSWLSLGQREQYDARGFFEVVGSDTGKRYRIYRGTSGA
jgi:hypothetical protein